MYEHLIVAILLIMLMHEHTYMNDIYCKQLHCNNFEPLNNDHPVLVCLSHGMSVPIRIPISIYLKHSSCSVIQCMYVRTVHEALLSLYQWMQNCYILHSIQQGLVYHDDFTETMHKVMVTCPWQPCILTCILWGLKGS